MTGNDPVLPPLRWAPEYTAKDFIVQEPGPLDTAEFALNDGSTKFGDLEATIRALALPSWTGIAADSFRGYLADLSSTVGALSVALGSASSTVGLTIDEIDGYLSPIAVDAAKTCNDAQVAYAKELINRTAIEAAGLPSTYFDFGPAEQIMATGMSRGASYQSGVQQALEDLASALLPIEEEFSYLTLPAPVVGTDAVVAAIFAPVIGAGSTTGQTPAAEAAFAYLTTEYVQLNDLRTTLQGLTATEREWVLDHLPSWLLTAIMLEGKPLEMQDDYEWFAKNLPLDQLNFLANADPHSYFRPEGRFKDGPQDLFWQPIESQADPAGKASALDQGALGNCHVLASLGAIATTPQGAEFFEKHIRYNSNGTFTVTLYDSGGGPFTVTVLPEVLNSKDVEGNDIVAFAQSADNQMNVFQIYEKALAQAAALGLIDLNSEPGGFGDANGGFPVIDMPLITGQKAVAFDPTTVTAESIQQNLTDGKLVTVTTLTAELSKPSSFFTNKQVPAPQHVYYVTDVNLDTEPPTVILSNPWGPDTADATITITLTIEELQNGTGTITVGEFS